MAFTTWTDLYANWLDAVANRNIDKFFDAGYENSREMRTSYASLGSVKLFTEWLKQKADAESLGNTDGEMLFAIGGN